jgi:hypothetical protein
MPLVRHYRQRPGDGPSVSLNLSRKIASTDKIRFSCAVSGLNPDTAFNWFKNLITKVKILDFLHKFCHLLGVEELEMVLRGRE